MNRALVVGLLALAIPAHADVAIEQVGAGSQLVAQPMEGPFPSLEAICPRLRPPDAKTWRCDLDPVAALAAPEGPWLAARVLATFTPAPPDDRSAHLAHLAVRTREGWFLALTLDDLVPGGARELRVDLHVENSSHDTERAVDDLTLLVGIGPSGRPTAPPPIHRLSTTWRGYPIRTMVRQHAAWDLTISDGVLTVRATDPTIGKPATHQPIGRWRLRFP